MNNARKLFGLQNLIVQDRGQDMDLKNDAEIKKFGWFLHFTTKWLFEVLRLHWNCPRTRSLPRSIHRGGRFQIPSTISCPFWWGPVLRSYISKACSRRSNHQKPRMLQDLVEMAHPPHSSAQRSQCTEEQTRVVQWERCPRYNMSARFESEVRHDGTWYQCFQ